LGNDPWCLHLIGVDAGHSVSGQLKGTRSVVTLTVKARQAIWLPALTGALILLLAVLAAWLAGTFLPPRVSRVLLHLEVCKDGGVTGLKEWADKADGRISTADVLARVRWAKRVGRGQVLASRASLKAALETKRSVIPECPLRDAGQAETTRGDQVAVDDLLTPGGAATVSTAEHLLQTVETATSGLTNFIAISKELINRISASADKDAAQKLADQTVANAKGYLSEFTLGKYLDSLQQALEDIGRRSTASETVAPGTAGLAAVSLSPSRLAASALSAVRSASVAAVSTARPMIAIVPFALLTLALMIIAVAGVLAVQYFPNPTFGSGADYLALAATAFGAAQAAAVLALLLLLRGPADWYG
jgi:hypothetical protein